MLLGKSSKGCRRDSDSFVIAILPRRDPFNAATQISFGLPEAADVRLSVWTTTGRLVDVIVSGDMTAGRHTVSWQADGMPAGVYLVRLEAGSVRLTRKAVLIK